MALTIFSIVAVAALPLVLLGIKAASRAEVQTLAKDLSQLRIERIRNLPYQVDRQNGPFVDLLDRYYTDASGTPSDSVDEAFCRGQYLANAAGPVGAPTGPAYRVTCTAFDADKMKEFKGYSQVIYLQFLTRTTVPVTPPTTYDSQTTGKDTAPSPLVGLTVLTNWVKTGQTGTLRTYTEIADARSNEPLIATQAQAVALRVSSNFVDTVNVVPQNRNLVAQAGVVKADGSLTSGSVASVQAAGISLDHVGPDNAVVEQRTGSVASTTANQSPSPSTRPVRLGLGRQDGVRQRVGRHVLRPPRGAVQQRRGRDRRDGDDSQVGPAEHRKRLQRLRLRLPQLAHRTDLRAQPVRGPAARLHQGPDRRRRFARWRQGPR